SSTTVATPLAPTGTESAADTVAPTPPDAGPAGGPARGEDAPPAPDDTAPPTSVVEAPPASPLAEYVTGVPGASRFDPAEFQRESRAHEEAIARCMAA